MQLQIGELAKLASCSAPAIRFYEKKGLLSSPKRTAGNYRLYGDKELQRLRFIVHCRKHGIKLAEIRKLLAIKDNPGRECGYVHTLVQKHLASVEEQINYLESLKKELLKLKGEGCCENGKNCAILQTLEADDGCPYCQQLIKK